MATVKALMQRALDHVRVEDHFAFVKRSPLHFLLWKHLCALSKHDDPLPRDIDEATEVSEEEVLFIEACLRYLPRGVSDWLQAEGRRHERAH